MLCWRSILFYSSDVSKDLYRDIFIVCLLCFICPDGDAERVVFYNTENLFDTRNDTLTADDDFTPRENSIGIGNVIPESYSISRKC